MGLPDKDTGFIFQYNKLISQDEPWTHPLLHPTDIVNENDLHLSL